MTLSLEHVKTGSAVLGTIVGTIATGSLAMTEDKIDIEVDHDRGVVIVHAISTGCTKAEDFDISRGKATGSFKATRMRPDRCRRKPYQVSFEYLIADINRP